MKLLLLLLSSSSAFLFFLLLSCVTNMTIAVAASSEQRRQASQLLRHEKATTKELPLPSHQQQQWQQRKQRHLADDGESCLAQNRVIDSCQSFDSYIQSFYGKPMTSFDDRVTIPCGICVAIDQSAAKRYTFNEGLDIQGNVTIDCRYTLNPQSVRIDTTLLLIQGYMLIDATCQLPIEDQPLVTVNMISKSDGSTSTFNPVVSSILATCAKSVCDVGEKSITVTGNGQVDFRGLGPSTPTWVKLYNVTYDPTVSATKPIGIVVPNSVHNYWTVGSLLAISSFTNTWNAYQTVRLITNMKTYDANPDYTEITLNDTITRPITQVDNMEQDLPNMDTSVEVMLLSRNIVFTTSEVVKKGKTIVGGHFWFYYTNLYQKVYGVDVQYFGQQGILGRYPLHYHYAVASPYNLLAKNTIRYSLQRCVVIHATNNVTISDNVAYDTTGHCYMTEDGIENYNQFIHNIGIQTNPPTFIIPRNKIMKNGGESDDRPATFWISNPTNDLIDNVAGGSEHTGIWYQLKKRGPGNYPHIDPITDPLGIFHNNVAHSNKDFAIRVYPEYYPKTLAIFDNVKIYRNNGGFLFHRCSNILMNNSDVSDNALGIVLESTDSPPIQLNNITIVGESKSYNIIVRDQQKDDYCDAQRDSLKNYSIGIDIRSYKDVVGTTASIWSNIQFYHFNRDTCRYVSPISIYYTGQKHRSSMFDYYTTMKGVTFHDDDIKVGKIDFCRADRRDIDDIYMTDLDGSLRPYVLTATSTVSTNVASIISLRQNMLKFVNLGLCTAVSTKCYSYCQDTCFRGIIYQVDPSYTSNFQLKICSQDDNTNCITVPGYRNSKVPYAANQYRNFPAYLPIGQYNAVFLDDSGKESWPTFVQQLTTDVTCPITGNHTVTMTVPQVAPDRCIELIRNGDADASNTDPLYWLSQQKGGLQLIKGGGVDGTNALASVEKDDQTILVQFLDTRCLNIMKNAVYKVTADIQLQHADGSVYVCNPKKEKCPTIGIFTVDGSMMTSYDDDASDDNVNDVNDGDATDDGFTDDGVTDDVVTDDLVSNVNPDDIMPGTYYQIAEVATASLNSNGFQSITGTVQITDDLINDGVRLYIQSLRYRLIVDNVSMKLVKTGTSSTSSSPTTSPAQNASPMTPPSAPTTDSPVPPPSPSGSVGVPTSAKPSHQPSSIPLELVNETTSASLTGPVENSAASIHSYYSVMLSSLVAFMAAIVVM